LPLTPKYLRKVIREEVKAAIQEELKDILLEAVKSPKGAITENSSVASKPQVDPSDPMLTSKDVNTFNPQGAMPGGDLPAGNVGLDQIMSLMNNK